MSLPAPAVLAPFNELSDAEQLLWERVPRGEPVDLTVEGADDPFSGGDSWGPERVVRAEFLAVLLRGICGSDPGYTPGVHLVGARVTGRLDVSFAKVEMQLTLRHCWLEQRPDFCDASTRSIRIVGSRLPGFEAIRLTVDGRLSLDWSRVDGPVRIIGAVISGELQLEGTRLINPGRWALSGGGCTVQGGFIGSRGRGAATLGETRPLHVEGGIRLTGARLMSGLYLDGVSITDTDGVAMSAESMFVDGPMTCQDGFRAEGTLRLQHARIEGELSFEGARLSAAEVALSLVSAHVRDLNLRTASSIDGLVDLRHMRCTLLRDHRQAWPQATRIDGFTYESVDSSDGFTVERRLQWLAREADGYRPQPYEQLAAYYRRLGADADARRVLYERQNRLHRTQRPVARAWGGLLRWTVGHGYRPWLAGIWLAGFLALGTVVFGQWHPAVIPGGPQPRFDPFVYTLDLLLPIGAFGLRDAFDPVGGTRWLAYALIAAGWLLATALIAGVTRAVRRD